LKVNGTALTRSISCKGKYWDITVIDSFYSILKIEPIYAKNYVSIEQVGSGIFWCRETFINEMQIFR